MIRVVTSLVLTAATVAAAAVDYAPRTVVVYNEAAPDSRRIAEKYARARKIPPANLVAVRASTNETITREEFVSTIESPLREAFSKRGWWAVAAGDQGRTAQQNSKNIVTLIHGVPLKIAEHSPAGGDAAAPATAQQNQASVDSELALLGLFDRSPAGALKNPYFGQDKPFAEAGLPMIMLVGRIDGPGSKVCERVIDDSIAVEATGLCGRAYLDLARKGPGYEEGDQWILAAGQALGTAGWPVIIDAHAPTLPLNYPMTEAGVYFGWWIRNVDGPFVNPDFRFRRGAVACHMHSFAAETVRSDAVNWVGPLLARGAAAVLGTAWEPYLGFCAREDIFISRLLDGYTLVEAAWMATPGLSWMNVVVGDPLYRPFAVTANPRPAPDDADFYVYRSAVRRLGSQPDKSALMRELETAAERRKSGILWEALGLLSQTYYANDLKRAAGYFEKAGKAYRRVPDRIRSYLHVPDMERRNDQMDGAVKDLKRIISEFPRAPETEAARAWLNTLRPPPPPAPNPLKR